MAIKKSNSLINLKEAARISGYSSDYIGQLIRQGKIFGEQVYVNVAWMTTAEEVLKYKAQADKEPVLPANFFWEKIAAGQRIFLLQIRLLKFFFRNFAYAYFLLAILLIITMFLGFFIAPFTQVILADKGGRPVAPAVLGESEINPDLPVY